MKGIQQLVDEIVAQARMASERGRVAGYIPELAKVDATQFGVAVALADGQVIKGGDADTPFSIQSISKVFMLALALGRRGDQLWDRVGREPSGEPFNSILQLERENGIPRNPFINAGALVVTDSVLEGHEPRDILGELLRFLRELADDDDIYINERVARSETLHGDRNRALAHFMAAHGNIKNPVAKTTGTYFHQCAIEMSCAQLARAGRFLMQTKQAPRYVSAERVRRINALMLTCGHYDGSGDFAFRVGLPGKSGVGGGILAVVPGVASICVWSPGLNKIGNSQLGAIAIEQLARGMGWSIFG